MVDATYTNHVKDVVNQIQNIYRMPNGKQRAFLDMLEESLDELPAIHTSWNLGDYVLVREDYVVQDSDVTSTPPSTMYVVVPGEVQSVTFARSGTATELNDYINSLTGIELGRMVLSAFAGDAIPNTTESDVYNKEYWNLTDYTGAVGNDYFVISYDSGTEEAVTTTLYIYTVATAGPNRYSNAVLLTGEIPLAQEDIVGGFYNVPASQLDAGYVYRDDTGHLRLLDYSLLRSGTLAYQLGEDFEVPANIDNATIQQNLDEYVNQRVAFPNYTQSTSTEVENPNVINITITLSESEEASTINIYDIDSRFDTSVYLHFTGTANSNTIINIANCQKVRIDSSIAASTSLSPTINVYNSCLYYDASVIDYINTHAQTNSAGVRIAPIANLSLWYEQFEDTDPNIIVNGMSVIALDGPVISENIDYWSTVTPNDNHYSYALYSLTFGSDGSIIGYGILMKNGTTANVSEGKSIVLTTFELPQSSVLAYPESSLTRQMTITGNFISSYPTDTGYMILNTTFTAVNQVYNEYSPDNTISGNISIYTDATNVTAVQSSFEGKPDITGWSASDYHIFYGGAVS